MNRRSIFTIIWSALREIWTGEIPDKYFIYEDQEEEDWGPIEVPAEGTFARLCYDKMQEHCNELENEVFEVKKPVPRGIAYWISHEA